MTNNGGLTRGQKWGVAAVVLGLLINGVGMVLAMGQWQIWQQRRLQVKQQTDRVAKLQQLGAERLELNDRLKALQAFSPRSEEDVAAVAQKLEAEAQTSGVELNLTFDDFGAEVKIGGEKLKALGMRVQVTGPYQGILKWVRGVQQLPYLINWKELKMGGEENLAIKAEFKGELFLGQGE